MNKEVESGIGLIELMISLVIGTLLVAAALSVYGHGRSAGRANENAARLQEQGRYALSVIEADVALAGLYGFTNLPQTIRFVAGGNPNAVHGTAMDFQQTAPPLPGLPAGAHACGVNFAIDVLTPLQGSNGVYGLACAAYGSGAFPGADTLTIRRVETKIAASSSGRLQIYASRLSGRSAQFLFSDGIAPGPLDSDHAIRNLLLRTYYIARDSVSRAGFPALRVKSMTESGGRVAFDEDEVITGVEDLQVQFGIDTGDYDNDGVIDNGVDANRDGRPEFLGAATRYVSPDFTDLALYPIVALRIWLRIRADEAETGFVDNRVYRYADVEYSPSGAARGYRRILMSRTVAVRNAIP